MSNYIKTLLLSTIVFVMGNNSNYCYSMEIEEETNTNNSPNNNNINTVNEQQIVNVNQDNNKGYNSLFAMLYNRDHIEEEINTNNSQNNNNINTVNEQRIVKVNQDGNEDYEHLFDVNYNKDYYDQICNNCINNVSNNKQEYKIFMKMVSQVFDNIIEEIYRDINNFYEGSYEDESIKFLKKQFTIPSDILEKFAELFDSISFIKNTRNNNLPYKLSNNNYNTILQLQKHDMNTINYIKSSKQLTNREKEVRINRLVNYRNLLSPIELLIYIQNGVRKLKAQTLKALEKSILNNIFFDNDNIINMKNEKIIKESQQVLEKIYNLYYNRVSHHFLSDHIIKCSIFKEKFQSQKWELSYEYIKNICKDFERNIARLDIFHYNGSNLQKMFDNLHKKIIATLNKVISDIDNNRLQNVEIIIPNVRNIYSKLVENTDSTKITTLFNNFKNTSFIASGRFEKIRLKEFLQQLIEKLEIVKKLTDRRIQKQTNTYQVLLNYNENEYNQHESIQHYVAITSLMIQFCSDLNSKKLIQCSDFLKAFTHYYNYFDVTELELRKEGAHILKYNLGQSPEETLKEVLLNNNNSFDVDGNDVETLEIMKDYARIFSFQ